MTNLTTLVQKHWNYCNILCNDRLSLGDRVEQLTFPLLQKMADVQWRPRSTSCRSLPTGKNLVVTTIRNDRGNLEYVIASLEIFAASESAKLDTLVRATFDHAFKREF